MRSGSLPFRILCAVALGVRLLSASADAGAQTIDSLTIVNGPEQAKTIEVWRETFGIR